VGPSDESGPSISFSYTTNSFSHQLDETPIISTASESIPLAVFSHHASTFQAICRYLVDVRKYSYSHAARILQRSPKTIWAAYHQTSALPPIEQSIPIPLSIFTGTRAPLEALVLYLKSLGLHNAEIARSLKLDPRTTWTAAKRGEGKQ
jgi:hypothetical protein